MPWQAGTVFAPATKKNRNGSNRNRRFTLWNAIRATPAFNPEMAVRVLSLGRAVAGLALFGLPAGHADAQSIQSSMGPQARATMRISVSVRPMFTVTQSENAVTVSSNAASSLRYAVVMPAGTPLAAPVIPADANVSSTTAVRSLGSAQDAAGQARADPNAIFLIVP